MTVGVEDIFTILICRIYLITKSILKTKNCSNTLGKIVFNIIIYYNKVYLRYYRIYYVIKFNEAN